MVGYSINWQNVGFIVKIEIKKKKKCKIKNVIFSSNFSYASDILMKFLKPQLS